MIPEHGKRIGLLTIPVFLVIIASLAILNNTTVFEPPLLLPLMNTVFLGFIPLFIAFTAFRTYRMSESLSVLMLGSGMLVFGLGSVAAGWLNGLPDGANITPTIHNTSVCIGSLFSLAAVLLVLSGPGLRTKDRPGLPYAVYGFLATGVALFCLATVQGFIPPFFVQGIGPTALRQVILSNATELYALAAVLFLFLYSRKNDDFFFFFSLAFALIAIGLLAVFIQPAVGSLIGWAGRCAQYAGACFALMAMMAARQRATREGIPLADQIDRFFGGGEATHAILAASKESVWLFSPAGTILMANPTAVERLGKRDAGEILGHDFREYLTPGLSALRGAFLEEVVRTGRPVRFEDKHNGMTFDHSFYPVLDRNGAVTGVAAFSRDITGKKQAEEALSAAHRRTSAILGQIADTYYSLDEEWRFTAVNPAAEKAPFGRPAQELIGRVIWDVYPALIGTPIQQRYFTAAEKQSLEHYEALSPLNGRWYEVFMQGRTGGVDLYMRDITRRKEAEHALRVSEERLTLSLTASGQGIWDYDVKGDIVTVSPRMAEIYGVAAGSFRTQADWRTSILEQDIPVVRTAIDKADPATGIYSVEYRISRGTDHAVRWLASRGIVIRDPLGNIIRQIGVVADITDRIQAAESLQKGMQKLDILAESARLLLSGEEPEQIVRAICERVMRNLDCDVFFNYLIGEGTGRMHLNAYAGIPETVAAGMEYLDLGEAVCGCVGRDGIPIVAADIQNSRDERTARVRSLNIAAYACHPLINLGKTIGTLSFGTSRRTRFSEEEVELMSAMTSLVATALARKKAEEALRQRQAEIRALIDNIPAGIVLFGGKPPYPVLVHNRYYQELFGEPYRSRGMVGLSVFDYAPAIEASGVAAVFDDVARTREPRHFLDFPYNSNPPHESWFNWYLSPIILDGNVVALVSMSLDVTDRHQAEKALRESEMNLRRAQEFLDSITKSTGVMIAAEDTEYRYTYFNKAYADEIKKLTGRELVLGMSMVDLFAHMPGEQENSLKQWKKVLGGKSIRQIVSFENPGRERKTFNVLHTPIRDGERRVIGAGEVSYDMTRQIQTEDELRKTSQYLENLINYANAPIIVWDREFRITRFNQAFERLTGRTAEEIIGQKPDILFPEQDRQKALALIQKAATGDRWEVVEIPILHTGGDIRIVLWNSATLYEDDGTTILATIAQGQDITESKHAMEAVKQIEARERAQLEELTKVLDAVPAAVWISHDPQAIHIFGNRLSHEWLDLPGGANMSKSAPLGEQPETFRMFRDGRELRPEEMPVQRSSAGRQVRNYEFDFRYPDGRVRHVLGNATPLLDESGNPRGSVSAFIDITDRRQAEETVMLEKKNAEETLSLLNATLESTADGIFVVDIERRITSYNQNFISLWNIRNSGLMTGDDRGVLECMKEQVKDPKVFLERILDLYRYPERERFDMVELQDGRIFERHSRPQKLKDTIIGRVWSYRDVTDRRRAEEKLLLSLKEKETLIREIHHRVKNNLQIVSGLLDMTRMRTPDSMTSGILTDMMMKIKTMAQIHTRLYESKQFDKINMGSQIRDQVTDLSMIYGRSGTEILCEIDVQDVYLPVDQAIPCALVVNEILSNAFKHAFRGRKQGNIRVMVTQKDESIRIIVKDDGIGIPKDVDVYRTTSLGLKLIRSLVLQLNGSVIITGNQGTEVTVECPFRSGGK